MPTIELTADELAAILRLVRNAIDADRFPHSDRVRTWKAALAKLASRRRAAARSTEPTAPAGVAPNAAMITLGNVQRRRMRMLQVACRKCPRRGRLKGHSGQRSSAAIAA